MTAGSLRPVDAAPDAGPRIVTPVPGPRSRELAARLARVECPEVTCVVPPPVVWERSSGVHVWDVDGNRFVDLLAGFGVAPLGWGHSAVTAAGSAQLEALQGALSDVYPARPRLELLEALERRLPGDLGCAILALSGSDAVEVALKTALRVTGRPCVVAFEGAYHGLGLGALDVTHREHFRRPFQERLPRQTAFVPFADAEAARDAVRVRAAGAILVEPVQARGGVRPAPPGFLSSLRAIADETGALLIFDEVYTGWGRTGHWLACEEDGVLPDLVCLGKAVGGGFPLSVCAGRPEVMRRWGPSRGEAIHTSTHLGHPVGCAMALATLEGIERERLPERARRLGGRALHRLEVELATAPRVVEVRGRGLMLGIELDSRGAADRVIGEALRSGWILVGEGSELRVLSLTPALSIDEALLDRALDRIIELCRA
ncbi:MAG: aspartate aminotransferase family protein [Myxococcota bacterium]